MSRVQYEFLDPPIQELGNIEHVLGRARDFVYPSELLELLARFAEDAQYLAVERKLVDPPRVRVRGLQHLMRAGRDAHRPRCARRLRQRRAGGFQLRHVGNRSDGGDRGRIERYVDRDLTQQLALAVEHLDAPVAAVRDVDVSLRIGGDAVPTVRRRAARVSALLTRYRE